MHCNLPEGDLQRAGLLSLKRLGEGGSCKMEIQPEVHHQKPQRDYSRFLDDQGAQVKAGGKYSD